MENREAESSTKVAEEAPAFQQTVASETTCYKVLPGRGKAVLRLLSDQDNYGKGSARSPPSPKLYRWDTPDSGKASPLPLSPMLRVNLNGSSVPSWNPSTALRLGYTYRASSMYILARSSMGCRLFAAIFAMPRIGSQSNSRSTSATCWVRLFGVPLRRPPVFCPSATFYFSLP